MTKKEYKKLHREYRLILKDENRSLSELGKMWSKLSTEPYIGRYMYKWMSVDRFSRFLFGRRIYKRIVETRA